MLADSFPLIILAFFEGLAVNGLVLLLVAYFCPVVVLFLSEEFFFRLSFNLEE